MERAFQEQRVAPTQDLPVKLVIDELQEEEPTVQLPRPEELPPMSASNDRMNAVIMLSVILVALIFLVVFSQIFV